MKRLPTSPERVALVGDVHGNLPWTLRVLTAAKDRGADVVIQLGDLGFFGHDDPSTRKFLARVDRRIADLDLALLWLDGNHENHHRLELLPVDAATGLRPVTDRIAHLPRGHRWDFGGATWMALGGAVSVDRQWRKEGTDWWPQEALTYEQAAAAITCGTVDVLLTHDAPADTVVPGSAGPSVWPTEDLERSDAHQALVRSVVDAVRPSQHWHAHMHARYDDVLRHPDGTMTVVHGLDKDNSWIDGNLAIVDAFGRPLADGE